METNRPVSNLEKLKGGLTFVSFKGDIRQPQNYAMGRIPARFHRWSLASSYMLDIERILKEIESSISFVEKVPEKDFLLQHNINAEDYVMYHQGYFLDLVHQLKDKLLQLTSAISTFDDDYKDPREVKFSKFEKTSIAKRKPEFLKLLNEWNDGINNGTIAIVLKKRTNYHHYKNPLSANQHYIQSRTHSFLLSPSFESQLSDYGKQMITERGAQSFKAWQADTLDKMSKTYAAIKTNLESISGVIVDYFNFPTNDKRGLKLTHRYLKLDEVVGVKDSSYTRASIDEVFAEILPRMEEMLREAVGDNLVSFYLTGSILRGEFIYGLSDINMVLVIKDEVAGVAPLVRAMLANAPAQLGIFLDLKIFSKTEFLSDASEKIKFICKTGGLLLMGEDLLTNYKKPKICFRLSWLLNEDFPHHLVRTKEILQNNSELSEARLARLARNLAKRAYWLIFSQAIGNNAVYTSNFREMYHLNNFFYPQNKSFNTITYKVFNKFIRIERAGIEAMIESYEENLIPLHKAIDAVVNGEAN
jgi:hypothetical protein